MPRASGSTTTTTTTTTTTAVVKREPSSSPVHQLSVRRKSKPTPFSQPRAKNTRASTPSIASPRRRSRRLAERNVAALHSLTKVVPVRGRPSGLACAWVSWSAQVTPEYLQPGMIGQLRARGVRSPPEADPPTPGRRPLSRRGKRAPVRARNVARPRHGAPDKTKKKKRKRSPKKRHPTSAWTCPMCTRPIQSSIQLANFIPSHLMCLQHMGPVARTLLANGKQGQPWMVTEWVRQEDGLTQTHKLTAARCCAVLDPDRVSKWGGGGDAGQSS